MSIGGDIKEVFSEVGCLVQIEGTELTEYIDYDFNVQVGNAFLREHMRNASFSYDTAIQAGNILYVPKNGERLLVVNFIPEMFEDEIATINSTLYLCNVFGKIYRETEDQDIIVTFQQAGFSVISPNHGLVVGQKVNFRSTGTLPSAISTGTEYYVVSSLADSFSISDTLGGTAIEFATTGLGTHKVYKKLYSLHDLTSKRMLWEEIGETHAVFTSSLRGNTSQVMERQDFADLLVKQNLLYIPDTVSIRPKDRFWLSEDEYYTVGNVERRRFRKCGVCDLTEDTRHINYA